MSVVSDVHYVAAEAQLRFLGLEAAVRGLLGHGLVDGLDGSSRGKGLVGAGGRHQPTLNIIRQINPYMRLGLVVRRGGRRRVAAVVGGRELDVLLADDLHPALRLPHEGGGGGLAVRTGVAF